MPMSDANNIRAQMRKGILEYYILLLLSSGKAYSSYIIERLREANLIVVEGTMYTLLNRLRKEGKLNYEWQESTQGPPRKYYFITDYGREVMHLMGDAWDEICSVVNHLRSTTSSNTSPSQSSNNNETDS